MKHQNPLHPLRLRSLALLGCLLALCGGFIRAQARAPIAERLDVYSGETKLLPIDGVIDTFNVSPDGVVKVTKSDVSPNQLNLEPLTGGSAVLTVKSGDRTLVYDLAVSPSPERLYINLNESKRLSFPNPIDDTSLSQAGVVRVVQPDTSDKVLLVEAIGDKADKTTLTVYSKGEIYRYFISTFENRGADILAIQNAFSAKGYRNLTITFDKDQAVIGGTVPTQEELDDAVRIVKQYTEYVNVKANLGQNVETSEYSEEEAIIINNIQRIANVKGLTVRVKFPMPSVVKSSTYTTSVGDYIEPTTTTTPQGGTVRGSGFTPPPTSQSPNGGGPLESKPQQNTTETVTRTENTTIPEKIFLYGDMDDDLAEAKVIRVARTFCPFIVNFLTVRDPIQLRTQIRFMQFKDDTITNTGFDWSNGGNGPTITLGFGGGAFNLLHNPVQAFVNFITAPGTAIAGVTATVNASVVFNLYETLGLTKILREADLFLTNGQPGWYSEGEVQSYVSAAVTTTTSPPVTTLTASSVFLGVNMDISPLNLINAGGVEPTGQKIFGIPSSVGSGSGSGSGYTLQQDSEPTPADVGKVSNAIQLSGTAPIIDNTVKYVDENGLIGMNISTQLTLPNGNLNSNTVAFPGGSISLPDFFVRTTRTRVNLRDGQSIAINGLIDKEVSRKVDQIPFLSKIPLFSTFFKSHADSNTNEEVIVLVTPHIVRMKDPDSDRYRHPRTPEIEDMAREFGDVPIIKPVRYDAGAIDIRPESPKDMKDVKSASIPAEPPPLTPRASGGMQTLLPPAESSTAAPPAVDTTPSAPDTTSRQPSGPVLAPSSTLP